VGTRLRITVDRQGVLRDDRGQFASRWFDNVLAGAEDVELNRVAGLGRIDRLPESAVLGSAVAVIVIIGRRNDDVTGCGVLPARAAGYGEIAPSAG